MAKVSVLCPVCREGGARIFRTNKRLRPRLRKDVNVVFRMYSCTAGHKFTTAELPVDGLAAEALEGLLDV